MNKKTNSSTIKKKSLGLRIFVLVLAVSLLLGIIILPLQSFAVESDTEAVIVTEFETGRLSDALLEAADGTDYNYIKKAAVSGGTLSAEDYSALQNIPNLEYIELAGAETKDGIIPENALPSRNQLTFISLPKNTVEIGAKAFSGNRKLVKVSMPDSVTKIDDYAFESCEALSDIPVTENITYIGEGAFRDCKSITEFTIPSNITEIYGYTFSKCGFSEIIIGPNVTSIADGAFADCNNLKDIYAYAENAPEIAGAGTFLNVGATVHVYEDSLDSYDSWNVNNVKTSGDLTGDYPIAAAEPTAEETEAPEETASAAEETSKTDVSQSEETETAETTAEEAAAVSAESKGGVSIAAVIVIAVVCCGAGAGVTALILNKKAKKSE